ncbi:MAG TPA: hypothetical protein VFU88_12485 [Ktedonobacterales bacterium]|nr:hypothetical protein [Ktedonobacterales bacterium]
MYTHVAHLFTKVYLAGRTWAAINPLQQRLVVLNDALENVERNAI